MGAITYRIGLSEDGKMSSFLVVVVVAVACSATDRRELVCLVGEGGAQPTAK